MAAGRSVVMALKTMKNEEKTFREREKEEREWRNEKCRNNWKD
ncbi:hypothetical protein KSS87_014748 [Heliosperma pusillum]|nr:hypothetical protein KSS87_014748 [Heliosperma pusillum]